MPDHPVFGDDDLVAVSALQHLVFCERQFALIHVEGLWAENRFTIEGRQLHEKADSRGSELRDDVRILRGVPLHSARLGLVGRADVVECHPDGTLVPVEYKRGQPKRNDCDRVQLCAQALCLEESFRRVVEYGYLFYGRPRRRVRVEFDPVLRQLTEEAIGRARALLRARRTPRARREPKCESCSMLELCLPDALDAGSARRYFDRATKAAFAEELQ